MKKNIACPVPITVSGSSVKKQRICPVQPGAGCGEKIAQVHPPIGLWEAVWGLRSIE